MKNALLGLVAVLIVSSNAFAAEYRCYGKETGPRPTSIDTILTVTATKVKLADVDGSELELLRARMKNEDKNTYATYGDYDYDGYGGFIELRVPKTVRAGAFPAYYQQDTYSELGKVGETRIKLNCTAAK